MKYERLFTPISIRDLRLKNRIVMPAIHMMYNMDGHANEKFNSFYWRRAEGGAGLIVVGGCRFDKYGGSPGMMSLETDEFISGYKKFTDGMHERGCKVGVQLYHAGAYAHEIANEGRQAIAPSAVFSRFTKEMPRQATAEEIRTVERKCAEAAVRAKKAGFDMVEISGSAGYLICQFLSPKTNLRDDKYGGSWENRTRFAKELVAEVRKAVGDYPIGMRIAGNDFVPDSNTNSDAVAFARLMEHADVDMLNVTGGWHESVIPQITGDVPAAGYAYLAAAVSEAVSIPVTVSNRINDPYVAEMLLATGQAEMVSIGRALIADPDWAKKAEAGASDNIRKCLACNQMCLAKTFFAEPAECLINPFAGKEAEIEFTRTEKPKRVLVVGGGVAGCETAILAAQRGHRVTVWEKSGRLGGQLGVISRIPAKDEFGKLITYFESELEKLGVDVVVNKAASADDVVSSDFDSVVTAAGSTPKTLSLEGCTIPIYTAEQVLTGQVVCGKNVLVVGGGPVGCEAAQYLVREAAVSPEVFAFMLAQHSETDEVIKSLVDKTYRKVAILDAVTIGTGFEHGTAWPLMKDLCRYGVEQYPFGKILSFGDGEVTLEAKKPKTREQKARERETGIIEPEMNITATMPCDTIVAAIGSVPNTELFTELKESGIELFCVGDCGEVGNIAHAMATALDTASKL
ncbi:MAG: FAD-dependent oxidoreductase [Clostridia bacterium]|nr:FAD-dependent oxidoreductase [Clostridia bacterium]